MAAEGYMDKEIARELNRSIASIRSKRYKDNIKLIKFNEDLFEKLDNKNSWLLGLITADGTFKGNNVTLYNSEKGLLQEFKAIFETDNKINNHVADRFGDKKVWRLGVSGEKVIDDLKSLNAYGNKNKRNPFPIIPDQYKWAFIKGLFDGDGNFYKGSFSIAGREELIKFVYYWMCHQIKKQPNKIYTHSTNKITKYFQFSPKDADKIFELIEQNSQGTYNSEKYMKWKRYYDKAS